MPYIDGHSQKPYVDYILPHRILFATPIQTVSYTQVQQKVLNLLTIFVDAATTSSNSVSSVYVTSYIQTSNAWILSEQIWTQTFETKTIFPNRNNVTLQNIIE